MLQETLILFVYTLFVSFHNVMFVLLLYGIGRSFLIKYSPFATHYVGSYVLAHAIYNGCPLLEIENTLAMRLGLPLKEIGDAYLLFGDSAWMIRIAMFVAGIMMVTYGYRVWHNAATPIVWQNVFALRAKPVDVS